jgi:hypothetical protein
VDDDLVDQGIYQGDVKTTTDVVTPNFHQKKLAGEVINNPYKTTLVEYGSSLNEWGYDYTLSCSGTGTKKYRHNNLYFSADWSNATDLDEVIALNPDYYGALEDAKKLVSTQALANVASAEVQGLVELAEFRKTLQFIRKPVTGLNELFLYIRGSRKYKQYRLATGKKLLQFIADHWLKYRYAVMPMVYTAKGGVKLLERDANQKRFTARAKLTVPKKTKSISNLPMGGGFFWDIEADFESDAEALVRAYVMYDTNLTLSGGLGLRPQDVPEAIWELVPFSFVVDWFANVGDYVSAVTPRADVNVLASGITVKQTVEKRGVFTSIAKNPANYTYAGHPGGTVYAKTTTKSREIGLRASLTSKVSQFDFGKTIDQIHLADAIALMLGTLNRR